MEQIEFKNLKVKIQSGELVSVVGPNGSGKTILLKMICGKFKNDFVFIDNKNINNFSLNYKIHNLVCVFDDNIYNTSKPLDELKFYLKKLNFQDEEIENRVHDYINIFKLEKLINTNFEMITIEDRIFIKILSLLIINPTIFCIDDLLTYLKRDKKIKFLNYIKERNITLISVDSNMEDLLYFDKILIINKGKKELFDKTETILNNEKLFKELGLELPFIYDINNLLSNYDLINGRHLIYKELVDQLWK